MKRQETLFLQTVRVGSLKLDGTKIGLSYEVSCPYCGFKFWSRPKVDPSEVID
jgi:hypothetical protein